MLIVNKTYRIVDGENDTGVSGKIAEKMANIMLDMAKSERQVISITHLPQIAAMADSHYLIEKSVNQEVTTSHIFPLEEEDAVKELARMLGGVEITDAVLENAKEMKAQQQLAAIMDKQVASLESKNTLSEKDIELAEKELAVYQAQIALEEAQNNKNSMKLTRDETGNWSYQYVADESDIADKQQSYLDKINEWRTASINAAEERTCQRARHRRQA